MCWWLFLQVVDVDERGAVALMRLLMQCSCLNSIGTYPISLHMFHVANCGGCSCRWWLMSVGLWR
jgi:hypothetical protein